MHCDDALGCSMRTGKLYIFEGPDGVGKTTLASALVSHLHENRRAAHLLSFPGREHGTLGRMIWDLHHDFERFGVRDIDATSLQLLHVASHIDTVEHRIRPALQAGEDVVLDRFWWSTLVYGTEQGVPRRSLEMMIELELQHWGELTPDAIFLIRRAVPFRNEVSLARYTRLASEYMSLAAGHPATVLIENSSSVDAAMDEIAHHTLAPPTVLDDDLASNSD
jgi:dTMP kinase